MKQKWNVFVQMGEKTIYNLNNNNNKKKTIETVAVAVAAAALDSCWTLSFPRVACGKKCQPDVRLLMSHQSGTCLKASLLRRLHGAVARRSSVPVLMESPKNTVMEVEKVRKGASWV